MAGDVIDRCLGLGFLVAATRLYGVSEYGVYVVGLTAFTLVSTLVGSGLGRAITKDSAAGSAVGDRSAVKGTIVTGFLTCVPIGVLASVALVAGATPIAGLIARGQPGVSATISVFGVLTPVYAVNFVILQSLYGMGRIRAMVVANSIVEPAVRLAALVTLYALAVPGPVAMPSAYLVALIASTTVAGSVFVRRVWPDLAGVRVRLRGREMLAFAVPVMLTDLTTRGFRSVTTLLFSLFRTTAEVGVFDIVLKMAGIVFLFSGAVVTAFRPRIAALVAENRRADLSRETQTITRWILTVAVLPLGILIVHPGPILALLGQRFVAESIAVRVLSLGLLVAQAAGPLAALLLMSGRSKRVFAIVASTASLYTLAALVAIPAYGIAGAAAAATGTIIVVVPFAAAYVQRTLDIAIYGRATWKPVVAAAAALPVTWLVPAGGATVTTLAIAGAGTFVLYVGVLAALGGLTVDHDLRAKVISSVRRWGMRRAGRSSPHAVGPCPSPD